MAAIIKSTESAQLVLSFPKSKDLRIDGLNQSQASLLIQFTQSRYVQLEPAKTLKIYGVPFANLKDYAYDNTNYGLENLPVEEYRLKNEEVVGPEVPLEDAESEEDRTSFFERALKNP